MVLFDFVGSSAYERREGEVGTCSEGRVNIDEIDLPGELVQQTRHHQLVVAPDELVAPAVLERLGGVALPEVEECQAARSGRFTRRPALVDSLDDLERERDAVDLVPLAVLVVLAGPDELGAGDVVGHQAITFASMVPMETQ